MKNYRILLSSLLLGSSLSHAQVGFDEEVILNPGFISGVIQIGNEPLQSATILANSVPREFSSDGRFTPTEDNLSEIIYTLTVNVPGGEPIEYLVGDTIFNSFIITDNGFDRYNFDSQQVSVLESQTTQANFDFSNAGIVLGTVSTQEGSTLVDADILITRDDDAEQVITISDTRTNTNRNGEYRIAASPGDVRITCEGTVIVDDIEFGVEIEPILLTLAANEEVVVNCELPSPNTETFDLIGEINVNTERERDHEVRLTGPFGSPAFASRVERLESDGEFEFLELALGQYSISATTIFENGALRLTQDSDEFTPGRSIIADSVETREVNINSDVGFIDGDINLLGNIDPSIVTLLSTRAGETSNTGFRVFSRSIFNAPLSSLGESSVPYLLAGNTDSSIQSNRIRVFYNNRLLEADERISGNTTIVYPFDTTNSFPVISNETVNRDIDINFGEVTINFRTTDDTLALSLPTILGQCSLLNDDGNTIYTATVSGNGAGENGFGQPGSLTGSVRFYAPEGSCQTIEASARVNGSEPVFGIIRDLEVEGGTTVDIDIDGPRLTVQSPAANSIISSDNVDVIGLVTDDISVERLLVNGILATLVSSDTLNDPSEQLSLLSAARAVETNEQVATLISTGNPDDPNELSFIVNIPLELGPNQILVEAFDADGNRSSNERTVFRDDAEPTLIWTPADGTTIQSDGETTLVNIIGTADDDVGIQSITVEGETVEFTSTNNADLANEVSFTSALNLVNGMNFIEVVVTDISGREVMQIHRVDVVDNQAPIADAGDDQTVDQQDSSGAQVSLDGAGSSDPDGDDLSFAWSVNDEEFDVVSPTIVLPVGVHTATLTVTDPSGLSSSDTVTITVEATQPPALTVPGDVVAEATGTLTVVDTGTATAVDAAGNAVEVTSDAPEAFLIGETIVTYTATDSVGNTVTGTQSVVVQDTTAPTFDVNKVRETLYYTPYSHSQFTLATVASNLFDAVDGSPDVEITVTGNQPEFTHPYGEYQNYVVSLQNGKAKILLKPEINRYSSQPGVYTITFTATDASGNSTTEVCIVKVVKQPKQRPWYYSYR